MTAEPRCWGGVSHPLQLTTGLVIKIYNNQSRSRSSYRSRLSGRERGRRSSSASRSSRGRSRCVRSRFSDLYRSRLRRDWSRSSTPRRVWRRWSLSLLWPEAAAGVPPVSGGASVAALPSVFAGACQVLHELVWLLFPGSTWSLGGCDRFCSSVGGVSRAPLRLLLERPLFVLRL